MSTLRLAYMGLGATEVSASIDFAMHVLGMQEAGQGADDERLLRCDDRTWRLADRRDVLGGVALMDPDGLRVEVVHGLRDSNQPFQSPVAVAFVMGTQVYVDTPAGFAVEYGWGGPQIHADWTVASYDAIRIWGHAS